MHFLARRSDEVGVSACDATRRTHPSTPPISAERASFLSKCLGPFLSALLFFHSVSQNLPSLLNPCLSSCPFFFPNVSSLSSSLPYLFFISPSCPSQCFFFLSVLDFLIKFHRRGLGREQLWRYLASQLHLINDQQGHLGHYLAVDAKKCTRITLYTYFKLIFKCFAIVGAVFHTSRSF